MNINTIIDNLKANLAAGTDGQIHLTEQSFLMDLLKEHDSDTAFTAKVPWAKAKSVRFPLTCLVLLSFLYLFRCLVFALYWVLKKIRTVFVGKAKEQELSTSPRVNFILLLTVLAFYIYLIVAMIVFLLGSVLLFNPNSSINDRGAICMQQPCGVEKYVYLLNAAECWSNTGIKVLKGDEVEVTASGSFYSKIFNMYQSAKDNNDFRFERSDVAGGNFNHPFWRQHKGDILSVNARELYMYHATEASKDGAVARFGSLLVQIKDDYEEPSYNSDEHKIIQLDTITKDNISPHFTAEHAGVLNFSVNDIYLTDTVFARVIKYKKELELDDTKYQKLESLVNMKKNRRIWFDDNVGEVLLNITIHRNSSIMDNPPNGFLMKGYKVMENMTDAPLSFIIVILFLVCWLIIDRFKGRSIVERLLVVGG